VFSGSVFKTDTGQKGAWLKDRQWRRPWSSAHTICISWVGVPVSPREGTLQGKGTIGDESMLVETTLLLSSKYTLLFSSNQL
jgi:hypothetical protein